MPTPDGKIMHAEIKIGDSMVMVSDAMMNPATNSSIHLYVQDADAAWARATAAGAKVVMPIADMFWGDRYGVLTTSGATGGRSPPTRKTSRPRRLRTRTAEAMKNMPKP